jgi:arabinose-5-phosphate isomerase
MSAKSYIDYAKTVVETEIQAIERLKKGLDNQLDIALNILVNCRGRVVVCGMGKSGLIGKKISATLSSTGTPSFFLHPAEALHGDLGMLKGGDVLLSISNSGVSDELLRLIPFIKHQGIKHITLTGKPLSILAKNADAVLDISIDKEACPLQLAPMASTTATLVFGDVLAACLMEMKGFKPENFAQLHPAGALGRKLLSTVADEMRTENLPTCKSDIGIKALIVLISKGHLGMAIVLNLKDEIVGLVTDGDIRRALEKYADEQFFKLLAKDIMTANPIQVLPSTKIAVVEDLLKEKKIKTVLVAEKNTLKGVFEYNGVL